jgi:hypothetical protein
VHHRARGCPSARPRRRRRGRPAPTSAGEKRLSELCAGGMGLSCVAAVSVGPGRGVPSVLARVAGTHAY